MKQQPKVTVPFHAQQAADLKELRGRSQRIADHLSGYELVMDALSDYYKLASVDNEGEVEPDFLLRALVRIAALAQRIAEDRKLLPREWIGGPDDG